MNNQRIAARIGQFVDLNADFYHNGQLADPFALRRVEIYRAAVLPTNLVTSTPIFKPSDVRYPSPTTKLAVGQYIYSYLVPQTFVAPEVYVDVWYYFSGNPCDDDVVGPAGTAPAGTDIDDGIGGTEGPCDLDNHLYDPLLKSNCHRFWVYPDNWFTDDRLMSVNFGFEPLMQRFRPGDNRDLEIGLMPLPLYDFDYNLVMPMIPYIVASIRVETHNAEILIQNEPMSIALRQGSYRTNPFVLRWRLLSNRFLIGTYRYRVTIQLPNGVVQSSPWFNFSVS